MPSTSAGSAAPRSKAVGYRAKSFGVTRLTILSVVWADRIVAIKSSNGLWKLSSVAAGYSSLSRCTVNSARVRAPRGSRGRGGAFLAFFFAVLGGKQLARGGCDLRALGPPSESRCGGLHNRAKGIRPIRLQLGDHLADLRLNLFGRHRRRQVPPQNPHLPLFPFRRLLTSALAIRLDGVLPALDFLACDPLNETVVDGPTSAGLLGSTHNF